MQIDFRQGIVTYPVIGGLQNFLIYSNGFVSISTVNGRVDIAFAHKTEDYLYTETTDVLNAWGPLSTGVDYWLYWDIDQRTAIRTFGIASIEPVYGSVQPVSPVNGLHWFDTVNGTMNLFDSSFWRVVIRVFAAKINSNIFTPLGSEISDKPFQGTQVKILEPGIIAGRIIADNVGVPIRRVNGLFFTTEDDFFVNGSPVNVIRLEANIINGTALQNIAQYQVVKFAEFGRILPAVYNDIGTTIIAMTMENIPIGVTGTLCVQGVINNPVWNFSIVGAELWASSIAGLITEVDAHLIDPINQPEARVAIGRVITPTSIFFDQGLGGVGPRGLPAAPTQLATTTVYGISRLSVNPINAQDPIVVETNDPRLIPYVHPLTHPSTIITTDIYKFITGITLYAQLHELIDRPLGSLFDVILTAPINGQVLSFNGTNWVNSSVPNSGASILDELNDVTLTTPTTNQVLLFNGSQWVNTTLNLTTTLASLTDVTLTSPTNGQVLSFNGTEWVNTTDVDSLSLLTDVILTSPISGQVLSFNGTSWVNAAGGGGGGGATVQDDTTTNQYWYPTFTSILTGLMTTAYVSSTKLQYNPSTGTMYAVNFNTTSDEKLKTNIQLITNSLSFINQIQGVSFNWLDSGIASYGVIAQQIEQTIPEAVSVNNEGLKTVNYTMLIPFLIESIKELSEKIKTLENK